MMTVWWLHLRTQSNVRGSFLLLRPQFWFHACPPHTFINLTGEKISICKKIWKVDPPPPYWKARRPWVRAWPVLWRFWREFLNAAAKLSSFVQSQQGQRWRVYRLNREQEQKQDLFFPTSIYNPFLRWSFHSVK